MTDQIILTVPEDISERARHIANTTDQPVEQVLLEYLNTLPKSLPILPAEVHNELEALRYLSDDALWTIAREQIPVPIQVRANALMDKNSRGAIPETEQAELETLAERADRLMLRKAEAGSLLRQRGYVFTAGDYQSR
ncbi:MAG: hypothetical protein ACYDBJ_22110 [Aggregatilineales bacterium]